VTSLSAFHRWNYSQISRTNSLLLAGAMDPLQTATKKKKVMVKN